MTNREKLRQTIYYVWNIDFLPLAQEEMMVMFQALAKNLKLNLSGDEEWEEFMSDVNCLNSSHEPWFNDVFDKYF